jgi:hypothetical protein
MVRARVISHRLPATSHNAAPIDEVSNYLTPRYFSAPEAVWRLLKLVGVWLCGRAPTTSRCIFQHVIAWTALCFGTGMSKLRLQTPCLCQNWLHCRPHLQPMHEEAPHVERLDLHLPGEHTMVFRDDVPLHDLAEEQRDTKLTAWFKLNQMDDAARAHLYIDIPTHYT